MHPDTSFLIALQREFARDKSGPARAFLGARLETAFSISTVAAVEFIEGFEDAKQAEALLRPYHWVPLDDRAAVVASRIRRQLRDKGELIGDFDILIGATALASGESLVTDNVRHFTRIPELEVISFIE